MHWVSGRVFSPQGGVVDLGETEPVSGVQDLLIPHVGGGYAVSRVGTDGYLHLQASVYGRKINYDAVYSGPLPGGRAEAGITVCQEVVVSGDNGSHGSTGEK